MRKAQQLLITLASILFLIAAAVLIIQNLAVPVPVQFLTWALPSVPLGAAMAVVSLCLGLGIVLQMWRRLLSVGEQHKRTSRELERKDVSREEAEEKVKVLENKIETLEKALSAALQSSQSR